MPDEGREVGPAEVEALFARLHAQVRASQDTASETAEAPASSTPLAARSEAERLWAVTAEKGVVRGPGLKGALAYPLKRALRPFIRWYVEPVVVEQRQFNAAVLRLVDELATRVSSREHERDETPSRDT